MAGSMIWQTYTSDNGDSYAIFVDRSNSESVNASFAASPLGLPAISLPRNIKPRTALYRSDDGKTQRVVPVLTPADLAAINAGDNFVTNPGGVTVKISSFRGERIRIPKNVDTGLTT